MKTKLYSATNGLNVKVNGTRVPYNPETGVTDLVKAVNIVIDDSGRISRRQGYEELQVGNFHSLWARGEYCFVGLDDSLFRVGTNLALTGIRSGMSGDRICYKYTPIGVYYANGTDKGRIVEGVHRDWVRDTYVGPTTSRTFTGPPANPTHIEFFDGRLFVSEGSIVWFTKPYAFGTFEQAKDYWPFPTRVKMIKAVPGGMYVSDEDYTYFIKSEDDPAKYKPNAVAPYPCLEWSVSEDWVEATTLGFEQPGLGAIWSSHEGIVLGLKDGVILNLTDRKLRIPTEFTDGATLITDNKVISTLFY